MRPLAVFILGNTCSGKSTLGYALAEEFGGLYVSFGDRKRAHIRDGTNIGRAVNDALTASAPIPPHLGMAVIRGSLAAQWNFLSGYPISLEEHMILDTECDTWCAVHLRASEDVLYERFMRRGVCLRCQRTGVRGERCAEHPDVVLNSRPDATSGEWGVRRRLYRERIEPFVTALAAHVPVMEVAVDTITTSRIVEKIVPWIHRGGAT